MKKIRNIVGTMAAAVLATGCGTTNLSTSKMGVEGMADALAQDAGWNESGAAIGARLDVPLILGIVQIGTGAAPKTFVDELNKHADLVNQAVSISAAMDEIGNGLSSEETMQVILQKARQAKVGYVFAYTGVIDSTIQYGSADILDALIIPAFLVPSRKIEAKGTATGVLLETATGKVIFRISETSTGENRSTGAREVSNVVKLKAGQREMLNKKLAGKLVQQLRQVGGPTVTAR